MPKCCRREFLLNAVPIFPRFLTRFMLIHSWDTNYSIYWVISTVSVAQ
ncbi:hypothetical protein COI_0997 [Mannheimia haemolytica serotype A2 str. OVINE]|nr:hypothetical protein COI_0997 [Mannheimia haemolytica serotype A2 str. OVINE]